MRMKFTGVLLLAGFIVAGNDAAAQANTNLSNLTAPTAVNTHLLPGADATHDLGSAPLSWRSLYLSDTVFLRGTKFIMGDNNFNTSLGLNAGAWFPVSMGGWNVAVGNGAMGNGVGDGNTAVGVEALYYGGGNNTALGYSAVRGNTWGHSNVGVGYEALLSNMMGEGNTSVGTYSNWNSEGGYNVSVGVQSLIGTTTSNSTVAIGGRAGNSLTSSSSNVFVGDDATSTASIIRNSTAIGANSLVTADDQVRVGNTVSTSIGGYVGWTNLSDGRFKKNLKEDVPGLAFITKLRPVTYVIDMDALDNALRGPVSQQLKNTSSKFKPRVTDPAMQVARANKASFIQTGFVAQEVEKTAKELGFSFSGVDAPKNDKDMYGLRYAEFVVPLVKAVQELNEQNAALEERVRKLEEMILKNANNSGNIILSGARLEQNAPNPFNGTTVINYYIPEKEGQGRLVITDMKGAVVKAVNLNDSGKGQFLLNKGTVAAGEYIYTLWIGETKVDSKRMIITK